MDHQSRDIDHAIHPATRAMARIWLLLIAAGALIALPVTAFAETRTPPEDRVVTLTLPINNKQVTGSIVGYTTLTFTIQTEQGEQHRLLWNAIPGANVDRYWRYLEQPAGDAEALFELGDILIRHSQGADLAEAAFAEALALDPELAEAVKRSKAGKSPDGTPRYVGTADPQMWGELDEETMQKGEQALVAFCEKTQAELGIELQLFKSDRFMMLTDVHPDLAHQVNDDLNRAYRGIANLLDEDPDGNVFVGKCLVVLLKQRVDYIRFQNLMHGTDARGTGGMCHGFGNGHAHIAAIARRNPKQTGHIVVHEFAHAYLHRYKSPTPIPDWVNEGLAEHLAHQIQPPPGENLLLKTRLLLEGKQGLGEGFYDSDNLASWQYNTAGALTGYLLERGGHAYPKFIAAIKDGQEPTEALKEVYRLEPRQLTQKFMRRLDRELNKKFGT